MMQLANHLFVCFYDSMGVPDCKKLNIASLTQTVKKLLIDLIFGASHVQMGL